VLGLLARCRDATRTFSDCIAVQSPDSSTLRPEALSTSQETMAKALVAGANCKNLIGFCHRGDEKDKTHPEGKKMGDLFQKCERDPQDKARPLAANPATRDEAEAIRSSVYYFNKVHGDLLMEQARCLQADGLKLENQARAVINDTQASKTSSHAVIDCVDHDAGTRLCVVRADGQSRYVDDPSARSVTEGGMNPVRIANKCSGETLGNGTTVVTNGHCTKEGEGEREVEVYDKYGTLHKLKARCDRGYYDHHGMSRQFRDVSICELERKIEVNEVYFDTYGGMGNTCEEVEPYVRACGREYFEQLSMKPVEMGSFPARQGLTAVKGTLYYDDKTGHFNSDMMCTGGCSGSGVGIRNEMGKRSIVAVHAWGERTAATEGGSVIVDYYDYSQMRRRLSPEVVSAGGGMFQTMPLPSDYRSQPAAPTVAGNRGGGKTAPANPDRAQPGVVDRAFNWVSSWF
ncbi:MAG: hypothetical protein AB7P49_11470, partial [Bdellovibrionales bacterium]